MDGPPADQGQQHPRAADALAASALGQLDDVAVQHDQVGLFPGRDGAAALGLTQNHGRVARVRRNRRVDVERLGGIERRAAIDAARQRRFDVAKRPRIAGVDRRVAAGHDQPARGRDARGRIGVAQIVAVGTVQPPAPSMRSMNGITLMS